MLKGFLKAIAAFFVVMVVIASCSDEPQKQAVTQAPTEARSSEPAVPVEAPKEQFAQPLPASPWTYSQDEDRMGRGAIKHAVTESINVVSFGFPYQGVQRATLNLRRHPQYGRDVILSVQRGQFLCSPIDGCSVLVRFGDGKPQRFSAVGPEDHSSTALFIHAHDKFVAQAKKVSKVAIQAQFYQEGNHVFEFDVTGLKW